MESTSELNKLVGEQLSAVTFVQDYLQLDFDGKRLTLNVWPVINVGNGRSVAFGEPDYRDALCGFIRNRVEQVYESPTDIKIVFSDGFLLFHLAGSEEAPPERVVFEDTLSNTWAWW